LLDNVINCIACMYVVMYLYACMYVVMYLYVLLYS